jgi:hypothetical protein
MGRLKVRVGDAWEEVAPPPVEEVIVATEDPYVTDPLSTAELWYDPDAVRPPSMAEEVYVGPDDPDVVAPLNTVDLWYDPDDTFTTSGVPAGGTTGQALTKVDDVDGNAEWSGPYEPVGGAVLKAQVHAHHINGPITTGAVEWTPTLAAGDYLCQFQCSGVGTVTGIRYVNLDMETAGVYANVGQSKHWFNAVNIHYVMSNGVSVLTIPADGDYPFRLSLSASFSMDVNDFGFIALIPCDPGAVT